MYNFLDRRATPIEAGLFSGLAAPVAPRRIPIVLACIGATGGQPVVLELGHFTLAVHVLRFRYRPTFWSQSKVLSESLCGCSARSVEQLSIHRVMSREVCKTKKVSVSVSV